MGEWRRARWHITEAIAGDGTFLDAGCVNGLLMESVAAWCAERGLAVEPYGVDISPALADLARQRLPQWAGRIWAGTTWRTPSARCPAVTDSRRSRYGPGWCCPGEATPVS